MLTYFICLVFLIIFASNSCSTTSILSPKNANMEEDNNELKQTTEDGHQEPAKVYSGSLELMSSKSVFLSAPCHYNALSNLERM